MAPPRCMSLNLAVRYADVINSVILQDDFLPRTDIPLEDIIKCGRYPPAVRTAVPVDGRFENIVLSCNAISDHAIIWIEREAQRAVDLMLENERTMKAPENQRMDGETAATRDHGEEQQAALRRAIALGIADVNLPSTYGTFDENANPEESEASPVLLDSGRRRTVWNEWIARIFEKDESGQMVPRR
ncbi:unnamed protein product [Triticum turgidum subsp. durum]|uniref:Uncharacterized protein n=1 Tax=Triticum turgidum subsp. durum TaxID=4567 RepID=A0A9R1B8I2_TRITD|nr:unnamed protein product [Triticum turgidum subsp. durum]